MFEWNGRPRNRVVYETARALRERDGLGFKRIARQLQISPATAHRWTRDIELTADQRRANQLRSSRTADPEATAARAAAWSRRCRQRRLAHQLEASVCKDA